MGLDTHGQGRPRSGDLVRSYAASQRPLHREAHLHAPLASEVVRGTPSHAQPAGSRRRGRLLLTAAEAGLGPRGCSDPGLAPCRWPSTRPRDIQRDGSQCSEQRM